MYHGFIAVLLQRTQEALDLPHADPQFLRRFGAA
jgi:hypothetical protein